VSQSALPLAGLRVLVTRPKPQAEELAKKLVQEGAEPLVMPLLDIVPFTEDAPEQEWLHIKNAVLELDRFQHVIFISTNAARWGCYWVDQYWPQWPIAQHVYAIGKATAVALSQHGVSAVSGIDSMNSEVLLELPELQSVMKDKILIFRGVGGREHLAQQLRKRGADVSYCEVYRRSCPEYYRGELAEKIRNQGVSVISVSSGETLTNLCTLLSSEDLAKITSELALLVPSKRVAKLADERGFHHILIADNATDSAMIAALYTSQAQQ